MQYDVTYGDIPFGLSLLSQLGEGNISISPTSIRVALGMLYEGAKGETARQISLATHLPEDASVRERGIRELTEALNATTVPHTIRCANGLWIAEQYPVNPEFKQTVRDNYRAEVNAADFTGNPEKERADINAWVGRKTEGKIPELFPEGSIDSLTRLVLANALYFKAQWDNKFDPQYTQKQDFTLSNGETVRVDMMRKGHIDSPWDLPTFRYGEFDGMQAALLPYQGKHLASLILLPPKGDSVKSMEADLQESHSSLWDIIKELRLEEFARLEIPKHEVKGSFKLQAPLRVLGIERMFDSKAEFQGIGPEPLFVSEGFHQTYFKTDEEGSEGAAATGFIAKNLSMSRPRKPIEFVVDRPFLEAVIDNSTGALLFLNRIEDPQG